jgi:hypothetical protein
VPEPEEQLAGLPPLFVRAEEILYSKQDMLQFRAFDNKRSERSDSSEDDNDRCPCYNSGRGLRQPWPRIFRLAEEADETGRPLPSLPQ